ncbi:sesquipedalian-1 [Drosophila bipectinata]|uniref:sesquipedalian-1 n=1 Tax=Drosophila bipectinata TaxID=42026 RepID=UPI001C8A7BEE|nr:sesquipedalian-1 isoform X1 [Drosophila bipectinata]
MKINEKNLYVFAKTPPYDMEGFLNKRGEVNKAFQRRYFVLKGNLLFYFESRMDKEPLGLIIVEGCTIELSNEVEHYCFEIAFNGNRTYILSAENQESMEAWMKALTCAGYEYKRIVVAELQRQLLEIEQSKNKMLSHSKVGAQNQMEGSKPMPPPRRNPFNRPAPPLPDMPFSNVHFGSSTARSQQEKTSILNKDANGNGTPHGTPKATRRPPPAHHGTSIFYPEPSDPVTSVLPRVPRRTKCSEQQRKRTLEEFIRIHERFRQELMPDVTDYRERQVQPLIRF